MHVKVISFVDFDQINNFSELNAEVEKMTNDSTDLESLFGRICALDKCLGRVRQAQQSAKAEIQPKEEVQSNEQKVRILNRCRLCIGSLVAN